MRGCTDPGATNYNSNATVNDGSCRYPTYNQYIPPSSGSGDTGTNAPTSPTTPTAPTTPTQSQPTTYGGGFSYSGSSLLNPNELAALGLKPLPEFNLGLTNTGIRASV